MLQGFRRIATRECSLIARGYQTKKLGSIESLLPELDAFVFDCDGVIWKGDSLIPGVSNTLDKLRRHDKKIFFVTNNSMKSRRGYLKKFTNLGLQVHPSGKGSSSGSTDFPLINQSTILEVFSSSFAAAAYLERNPLPTGKKVYVIGDAGIGEELDLIGVPHFGGPSDAGKVVKIGPGVKIDHDRDVGAVIVGMDININYYKIQYAQLCINENPGCRFIATNLDAVKHLTPEQEWAGNGAIVGAIKGCTGKEPILVGKPSSLLIDYLSEKYHLNRSRVCMVGDRLDTDILFGLNNGLKTILTLSGVTTEEKLLNRSNTIHPHYYVNGLFDFFSVRK